MELQYQWGNCEHSFNYLQASSRPAKQNVSADKVVPTIKSTTRSKKRRAQIQSDIEVLGSRMQRVTELMDDIKGHDRHVGKATDAFDNAARAMFTALRGNQAAKDDDVWGDVSLQPSSAFNSVLSAAPTSHVTTQLDRFYDAVANLKIMRERFSDFSMEQQEQWERRVLMADQEQVLEQGDEDFSREWQQKLDVAEEDLRNARNTVRDARQACVDEGIAIPAWAEVSLSDIVPEQLPWSSSQAGAVSPPNSRPANSIHMHRLIPELRATSIASGNVLQPNISPLRTPTTNDLKSQERVRQWIEDVADTSNVKAPEAHIDDQDPDDPESQLSSYRLDVLPQRRRSLDDTQSYSRHRIKDIRS